MTYNHYLTQKLPMCQVELNQILDENRRFIYRLKMIASNA